MLSNEDLKEIKKVVDERSQGSFIHRWKTRKLKKELKKHLDTLNYKLLEYYNVKLRQDIQFVDREIKKRNIDIINHTAKDEEVKDMPVVYENIEEKS